MDIDISRWGTILALMLLVPGLVFLFVVVMYVAFVAKRPGPQKTNEMTPQTPKDDGVV